MSDNPERFDSDDSEKCELDAGDLAAIAFMKGRERDEIELRRAEFVVKALVLVGCVVFLSAKWSGHTLTDFAVATSGAIDGVKHQSALLIDMLTRYVSLAQLQI